MCSSASVSSSGPCSTPSASSPATTTATCACSRFSNETPTLDPFLLREQLRRHGLEPARCYFDLSPGDSQRMFDFAQREIEPLVRMSVGPGDADFVKAGRLTRMILANAADAALEPLRQTMQLDPQQFQEGVFCWKAFLYYKWQLADLLPRVGPVLKQIGAIRPRGPQTDETRVYLSDARETLCKSLLDGCRRVQARRWRSTTRPTPA